MAGDLCRIIRRAWYQAFTSGHPHLQRLKMEGWGWNFHEDYLARIVLMDPCFEPLKSPPPPVTAIFG